ncbi:MAG: type II toxin-antitoxin system HicB family antitoxin [Spirochaetes bacterium]|nr:type II toxin-antitoxin system HicB family antitoxin [Spirochaetota bacterium]
MEYAARIVWDEGDRHYSVSFPEFPNIHTYGRSLPEAMAAAHEALNGTLEADFEHGRRLPVAKKHLGKGYHPIALEPSVLLAYRLRQKRGAQPQLAMAKQLGISYQAYQRYENPAQCNPTLKTLKKIVQVFHIPAKDLIEA